ncbi:MAG: extracellular solute-binding protein [Propionibacteriaceae bacterium]|jgi:lactose/L-arabinose transport system substrate-binding protein|nr:extracellular solute-binding protein [Propionibacteriaceae bacterium]
MNTTKKLIWLAAAAALGLSMTACSSGDSGSGTSGGDTSAAGAATTDAGTTTTTGGDALVVWTWDPAFNIYAMNEAAKVYQADHPDFQLDVQEVAWDDIQTKLTTLAQSKTLSELPDIVLVQNNAFQKNVINYPELFSSFADSGIDFSQYPQAVTDYSVIDGVNWGLPFDNGTAVAAYRTDVLAEAGYTIADFTDITWSQFITLAEDVLAKTGKPLLSGQAGSSDLIMMLLQSAGASLFDADGNPTIAGNETLKKAVALYQELVEKGILVEVNSWDEYIATFVTGQVAGTINGCWILASVQTATDQSGLWDITNLPKMDDVAGATNYSANGGSSWAITSNVSDYALAADFLKSTFAGSTAFYDTILPSSGAIANWLPASKSSVYAEPQAFFGGDAIYAKIVEYAASVPSNNTGAYYYEGRDAVSTAITEIINGADPDTALQTAQETVEFAMG